MFAHALDDLRKPRRLTRDASSSSNSKASRASAKAPASTRKRCFESDPTATAVYGPSGALTSWTYFFLGHPDLVIQARAVRRGQRFQYEAGKHIHHPGRTVVTVLGATATTVNAKLDWESNAGDYVGSGTFGLRLTPTSSGEIDYQAIKSVVKVPAGAKPDKRHPVVRRSELCGGPLSP